MADPVLATAPTHYSPGRAVHVTMPAPTLDVRGTPVDWTKSETRGPLEDVRVIFGSTVDATGAPLNPGEDVTFWRGGLAVIEGWESSTPYDDKVATIRFPEIKTFEAPPAWLVNGANVEIVFARPDGTQARLWEGMYVSEEDVVGENDAGTRIECLGALYQGDFFTAPAVSAPEKTYLRGGSVPGISFERRITTELTTGADTSESIDYRQSLRLLHPVIEGTVAPENDLVENPAYAQGGLGIHVAPNPSWEPMLTGRIGSYLALAADSLGQWTLMKKVPRTPVIRRKTAATVTHTVHVGAPGVTHNLKRDITQAPNAIYGEGSDPGNCRWRNTKYPRWTDAPGVNWTANLTVGNTSSAWIAFERVMVEAGWAFDNNGRYDSYEKKLVERLQLGAGRAATGIVDQATWNVVFDNSQVWTTNGALFQLPFFAPLAVDRSVEPYLYNHTGAIIGDNPLFLPSVPRVERYENYGPNVTREEATVSAEAELDREIQPGYVGTVTLRTDPQTSSLIEIKAGHRLVLRGHRGVDRTLYIANAKIDYQNRSATLTVDEKERDLPTLASIIARKRELADPARRPQRTYRNGKAIEDRFPQWDCESGAGRFRRMQVSAATWAVQIVPAGTGSMVRTEFKVDTPARFSVGVFDRKIDLAFLTSLGSPLDARYWDDVGENRGLVIAWGGEGQAGGYYPGTEMGTNPDTGAADPLTGRLVENAAWYVENYLGNPMVWVAVWVESPTTNFIQGRFFPAAT